MAENISQRIKASAVRGSIDGKDLATMHVEGEESISVTAEERLVSSFPESKKKKLLRKLDLHIIPCLISLYLMSYIDRANIGNANIEGMSVDLGLTGNQYNIVLSIFFVTYIIFGSLRPESRQEA
ncbi:unnamed protein product [Clonostachys byssicola]|uniref:Uncharacterized protein n=1 Tax=Clonostachys byssicola TaxID=160290 RepID=A0A9N9UQ78_9HYPO|nr:unnamed protein product [Clonostachys byssicola]